MRFAMAGLMLLAASFFLAGNSQGFGDKKETKEVTLKGKITCGKCELGKDDSCATVIVVKQDKNETIYYFDPAGHKKYHAEICSDPKKGSVTGTIATEGKKMVVKVSKVTFE